jgi:ribonuclease P protein component
MNARYTFPRSCRLLKTDEFSSVFNFRCGKTGRFLNVYAQPNVTNASARLGIVVGKKQLRTAVARNLAKRVVRDVFRLHQHDLPNLDYIVRIIKPFTQDQSAIVRNELLLLLKKSKRCLDS